MATSLPLWGDTVIATITNLFGRSVIYSNETAITRDNVVAALNDAWPYHQINSKSIDYLYNYYKGNQPILNRVKTVRAEINNKIVENHAYEIVDFKRGYIFGEPIQYVRRATDAAISEKVAMLNGMMLTADKARHDNDLAEWFFIGGTAYRIALPDSEDVFSINTLDPRYTFVVYSSAIGNKPLMGVTYVEEANRTIRYYVYTEDRYFEVLGDRVVKETPHVLGDIPIIEYPANNSRLGAFEIVIGLLDALNNSASNRMDGIEQFIQSFIKFINCEIDTETFKALKDMGAIKIKGEPGLPADVDIVSRELNQSQVQVQIDHMYNMVLIICGMPSRQKDQGSSSDTGQAVILRSGWTAAESRARDTELIFKSSEKRFLKLVLRIARDSSGLDLNMSDLEIKFTRNKTDALLTKTQGLQNLLEAGVNPETAFSIIGLFSDPQQAYIDSQLYLEKWKTATASNATSNQKPDPV